MTHSYVTLRYVQVRVLVYREDKDIPELVSRLMFGEVHSTRLPGKPQASHLIISSHYLSHCYSIAWDRLYKKAVLSQR